ncbi:hypothetical protein CPCC7001_2181 [Cyanobium sp. PCC 7001]|nr:hypothetical protein CPCC7001_2181 [Cyanobium sp. PCC 7001]
MRPNGAGGTRHSPGFWSWCQRAPHGCRVPAGICGRRAFRNSEPDPRDRYPRSTASVSGFARLGWVPSEREIPCRHRPPPRTCASALRGGAPTC